MDAQRRALIVATDEYEQPGLQRLLSPSADAAALAEVLGDPQIGGFEVRVVQNEPEHVIRAHIEDLFSEARSDDLLLLHLSCHGLKNDSGELFFAACNTRPDRLASTAIGADFVQRCLRSSRSRCIVLLLDCCYGGAFSQGVTVRASGDAHVLDSFPGESLDRGRGRAVITASSAMEYAFEGNQLADDHRAEPSVFSSALVNGLASGDADLDEDGWVSLSELYDYVFDQVRTRTPHQTPSRDIQMAGELYVARSRRRRIRPHPLPADLQAAITSPEPYARRGAVEELRARLASDDLSVAAGAYEVLLDTARTDSTYVAEAASAALRGAAVHALEPVLDFGEVPQGSVSPRRTIRLQGPPLARAVTADAPASWIRVDEVDDVLHVAIDTSSVGFMQGEIALKGPTGAATIAVQVDVTASRRGGPDSDLRPPHVQAPRFAPAPPGATATRNGPQAPPPPAPVGNSPRDSSTDTGDPAPQVAASHPSVDIALLWRALRDQLRPDAPSPIPAFIAGIVTLGLGAILLTMIEAGPGDSLLTVFSLQLVVYGVYHLVVRHASAEPRQRMLRRIDGVAACVAGGLLFLAILPVAVLEDLAAVGLFGYWPLSGILGLVGLPPREAVAQRRLELARSIGSLAVIPILLLTGEVTAWQSDELPIAIYASWLIILAGILVRLAKGVSRAQPQRNER